MSDQASPDADTVHRLRYEGKHTEAEALVRRQQALVREARERASRDFERHRYRMKRRLGVCIESGCGNPALRGLARCAYHHEKRARAERLQRRERDG